MGPCTANARRPTVDSRFRGTTISCCEADLRRCLPTTSVTVVVGFHCDVIGCELARQGVRRGAADGEATQRRSPAHMNVVTVSSPSGV